MRWHRATRQVFAASRQALWAWIADPTTWPLWCRAVAAAQGRADLGGHVAFVPAAPMMGALHARTAPAMRVLARQENRRLTVRQAQPGGQTTLTWTLEPVPEGTRLTLDLSVRGPLTLAARAGFGPFITGFDQDCARLAGLLRSGAPQSGSPPHKVVIADGSGSLGRTLAADLTCRGHEVVLLTRRRDPVLPYRQATWDARTVAGWSAELGEPGRTSLVNLSGWPAPPVRRDGRGPDDLHTSRVAPTTALVTASQRLPAPLREWVQGSTTAVWSGPDEAHVTESTALPDPIRSSSAGAARDGEEAAARANTRALTVLRTSTVLQAGSPELRMLTRPGLGGWFGDEQQWFSWIHVQDWLAVVRSALGLSVPPLPTGVVVASAPAPVRHAELRSTLRRVRRPLGPPVPAPSLTGRHCTSAVLAQAGFGFAFPTLDTALADLLR